MRDAERRDSARVNTRAARSMDSEAGAQADPEVAGAAMEVPGARADAEGAGADAEVVGTEAEAEGRKASEAEAAEDSDSDWEEETSDNDPPELATLRAEELESAMKELGTCAMESFSERLPCVAHKV